MKAFLIDVGKLFLSQALIWAGIFIILLSGCASERFLSPEQDAEMRANCQEGCTVIPNGVMAKLIERLKGRAI